MASVRSRLLRMQVGCGSTGSPRRSRFLQIHDTRDIKCHNAKECLISPQCYSYCICHASDASYRVVGASQWGGGSVLGGFMLVVCVCVVCSSRVVRARVVMLVVLML